MRFDGFRASPRVLPWMVAGLALLATVGALANDWTLDADIDITSNRLVTGEGTLLELLTSDYVPQTGMHSGFWRPVVGLFYWIFWRLGGGRPFLFLAGNVLLHAAISAGVFLLARRLGGTPWTGFAAGTLFAVHPVHTDVTAGVVGLKDLLAAAGFLFGLLLQLRGRAEGSRAAVLAGAGLFLAGILSKESALALVPALLLLDLGGWCRKAADRLVLCFSYGGVLAAVGLKFGLQHIFLGATVEGIGVHRADNPLILLPWLSARLHALEIVPLYARLLFWPHPLSPDYGYNSLPLGPGAFSAKALFGGLILGGLALAGYWAWRRGHGLLFAGLALLFSGYLPISNLLVLLGTHAAERFLYLPSIGFCLAAGWLLAHPRLPGRLGAVLLALLAVALGTKSEIRNRDWRDLNSLWSAAATVVPGNFKVVLALAQERIHRGEFGPAAELIQKALETEDPDPRTRPIGEMWRPPLMALQGAALTELNQLPEAFAVLQQATALAPGNVLTRFHSGRLLHRLGDPAAAADQLDAALQNGPSPEQRRWIEDEKQAVEAARRVSGGTGGLPARAAVKLILCDRRFRAGDLAGAIEEVKDALEIVPGHIQARMNLGIILLQAGRPGEAEAEFRTLAGNTPENPGVWFLLGNAVREQGRLDEAREAYRQAAGKAREKDPLFQEIRRALATLPPPPR